MDANGVIKVSDFGLAEDIYSQNYFRQVEGGVKLPLKWMALESIKLGVFTEKTDVVRSMSQDCNKVVTIIVTTLSHASYQLVILM